MNSKKQKLKKQVKEHMPKDWLSDIRIIYRITMEAVNDIKRTGIMNLVIITTMAAILSIFGALFRTTISMSQFAHELGSVLEISVYLKQDAPAKKVADKFAKINHVTGVRLIPRDVSWKDLRKDIDLPNISNPLPDTLHVKVDTPLSINDVLTEIKQDRYVEDTGYAEEFAKRLQLITHVVNTTTLLVTLIVAILTITIINNTIQLVIQSRKEEIEIMRLMGVSNWYIRIPLVLQGAFYGFAGATVALIPLQIVQNALLTVHKFFLIPAPALAENMVILTLLSVGVVFGAGGSLLSIKKHLQV
ncbi:MAG: ABC transporter permease [Candidatus Gastranaerophilales bacterium]|nr:ABC transporter permease [Candidatus Gastranaerophilales bacterium]